MESDNELFNIPQLVVHIILIHIKPLPWKF